LALLVDADDPATIGERATHQASKDQYSEQNNDAEFERGGEGRNRGHRSYDGD
jgi:hypothetical protein